MRIPVMPAAGALAHNVYLSLSGVPPVTRYEPSSCGSNFDFDVASSFANSSVWYVTGDSTAAATRLAKSASHAASFGASLLRAAASMSSTSCSFCS